MFKQGFNKHSVIIFREVLNFWSVLAVDISLKWEGEIKDIFFQLYIIYLFFHPCVGKK